MTNKETEKKIRGRKGETFAETLVALLIGVLALLMLSMSIVSAAKVNRKIRTDEKLSTVEIRDRAEATRNDEAAVWFNEDTEANRVAASVYVDAAGYVYYDYGK